LCPQPLVPSLFYFSPICRPPSSTLFPYTTLFRSGGFPFGCFQEFPVSSFCPPGSCGPGRTGIWCPPTEPTALWWRRLPRENPPRSEEHTSELQSRFDLVCRLLLETKKRILSTVSD